MILINDAHSKLNYLYINLYIYDVLYKNVHIVHVNVKIVKLLFKY